MAVVIKTPREALLFAAGFISARTDKGCLRPAFRQDEASPYLQGREAAEEWLKTEAGL